MPVGPGVDEHADIKLEDLITVEDVAVTVSHSGYVKRTPYQCLSNAASWRQGRIGMRTRDQDFVEYLFVASTHSYLLIFTDKGKCTGSGLRDPRCETSGKGRPL